MNADARAGVLQQGFEEWRARRDMGRHPEYLMVIAIVGMAIAFGYGAYAHLGILAGIIAGSLALILMPLLLLILNLFCAIALRGKNRRDKRHGPLRKKGD
jgi:hypothetical protein